MREAKMGFLLTGICILLGIFLWVSFPAPVDEVRVPLNKGTGAFSEVVFSIPKWGWVGRSTELRVVLIGKDGERRIVRSRMETSPEVSGRGEETQVVKAKSPVQFSWQLMSMTSGRKTWRVWLWVSNPDLEDELLLMREGTIRFLGITGVPVIWIQVLMGIVIAGLSGGIGWTFRNQPPRA